MNTDNTNDRIKSMNSKALVRILKDFSPKENEDGPGVIIGNHHGQLTFIPPIKADRASKKNKNDLNALIRNTKGTAISLNGSEDKNWISRMAERFTDDECHPLNMTRLAKHDREWETARKSINTSGYHPYSIVLKFTDGQHEPVYTAFKQLRFQQTGILKLTGITPGLSLGMIDSIINTIMEEDDVKAICMDTVFHELQPSSMQTIHTRRPIHSTVRNGIQCPGEETVSTGYEAIDDTYVFRMLVPNLKEAELAILQPLSSLTEIRRREHGLQVFTMDVDEDTKAVDPNELDRMRDDCRTCKEMAAELRTSEQTVRKACAYYGVGMTKGTRSRMTRMQMADYKARTGLGSPAADPAVRQKIAKTNIRKYGHANPFSNSEIQERIRTTNRRKYGVDNPQQNSMIHEKTEKTMKSRYGAKTTLESGTLKSKCEATCISKYGVHNPMMSPIIQRKAVNTCISKYGMPYAGRTPESNAKRHRTCMEKYGYDEVAKVPEIRERMDRGLKSSVGFHHESCYEQQVREFFDDVGVGYKQGDYQTLGDMQLDFLIADRKLAIEVSPVWTHHSNVTPVAGGFIAPKPMTYHQRKYDKAEKAGIELITLFSWSLDEPVWSRITRPFLKMKLTGKASRVLYGRNVRIIRAASSGERKACIEFCRTNHFKGSVPSKWWYRVVDNQDTIVGVFSLQPISDDTLELKRVCWAPDVQVRYGLSKIVKRIARDFPQYDRLKSYSDNSMGSGRSYEAAGFDYQGETKPTLHFINSRHPQDSYSWSVATPWSARSGVIAKALVPMDHVDYDEARIIVETRLPHRADNGVGYLACYDTGNKRWSMALHA